MHHIGIFIVMKATTCTISWCYYQLIVSYHSFLALNYGHLKVRFVFLSLIAIPQTRSYMHVSFFFFFGMDTACLLLGAKSHVSCLLMIRFVHITESREGKEFYIFNLLLQEADSPGTKSQIPFDVLQFRN